MTDVAVRFGGAYEDAVQVVGAVDIAADDESDGDTAAAAAVDYDDDVTAGADAAAPADVDVDTYQATRQTMTHGC